MKNNKRYEITNRSFILVLNFASIIAATALVYTAMEETRPMIR